MTNESVSDEDLEQAYREHAERTREINEEWKYVSIEANQYLGEPATIEMDNVTWDPENGLQKKNERD